MSLTKDWLERDELRRRLKKPAQATFYQSREDDFWDAREQDERTDYEAARTEELQAEVMQSVVLSAIQNLP